MVHLIDSPALLNGWHLRLDYDVRATEKGTVTRSAAETQVLPAPEDLDLRRARSS
jgi:hypothetical protein